jgi:hypothetical protein
VHALTGVRHFEASMQPYATVAFAVLPTTLMFDSAMYADVHTPFLLLLFLLFSL